MHLDPDNAATGYSTLGFNPDFFKGIYDIFFGEGRDYESILSLLGTVWSIYSVFAFILSAILIYGIIYSYIRFNQLAELQVAHILAEEKRWHQLHDANLGNRHWQEVQSHIGSDNPNDWKLAIIEADVMLEHMLEDAGYAGTTIADRLRSATNRSFATIDDAWQAHRLRNHVAHGGSDFVLTQKAARDAVIQYQKVFQEFGLI